MVPVGFPLTAIGEPYMSELPNRTPRKRLTREESRAVTRARLLESAHALFSLNGYEGTSVDEIAKDAGYTRGAFYSNFSDKQEIMRELINQGFEGDLAEIARFGQTEGADPAEAFEALARSYYENPENTLWSLEFQLAAIRHPELREAYGSQFDRLRTAISVLVEDELRTRGMTRPERAAHFADVYIAVLSGLTLVKLIDREKIPEGMFAQVYRALAAGIPEAFD